jgi:hypothetical protein
MPQSVVTANSARELCDFFEKVGSNFSINKIKNESRPLYLARGKPLRRKGVVELPSQGAPIPLPFPEKTKMNNAENSELSRFPIYSPGKNENEQRGKFRAVPIYSPYPCYPCPSVVKILFMHHEKITQDPIGRPA